MTLDENIADNSAELIVFQVSTHSLYDYYLFLQHNIEKFLQSWEHDVCSQTIIFTSYLILNAICYIVSFGKLFQSLIFNKPMNSMILSVCKNKFPCSSAFDFIFILSSPSIMLYIKCDRRMRNGLRNMGRRRYCLLLISIHGKNNTTSLKHRYLNNTSYVYNIQYLRKSEKIFTSITKIPKVICYIVSQSSWTVQLHKNLLFGV